MPRQEHTSPPEHTPRRETEAPAKARVDDARTLRTEPRRFDEDFHADVDDASEASFPASDPPAWSGLPPGGPRRPRDGTR